MKKLLLLLFSATSLLAMQNQEQTFSIEGHNIVVRYNARQQFISAKFAVENYVKNTYVSKDLRANKFFPRTRYAYYSECQGRYIYLPDALDTEQVQLLKTAIKTYEKNYEKDMEID